MNNATVRSLLSVTLVAGMASACTDQRDSLVAPTGDAARTASVPSALRAHARGIENEFLELERAIPGFGGFYFDERGDLNVFYRGEEHRTAATNAVRAWAEAHTDAFHRPKPAAVIARAGRFAFSELVAWQTQLRDFGGMTKDGIQFLDADEAHNRVHVIVATPESMARVAQLAASHGIPQDALNIEVGRFDVELTGNVQTTNFSPQIPAGVQITYRDPSLTHWHCTMGFM
jgi:hypothetical protein